MYNSSANSYKKLKLASIISDNISNGDIIETNIYTDQNWYLQNIHGFYTCCVPSFYLNNYTSGSNDYSTTFSSDLNKTSLKNINRKNINTLKSSIKNKSTHDIMFINKIFYNYAFNEEYEKIAQLMKKYNITLKEVEIFIKIDKTVKKKVTFSTKIKRLIESHYKKLDSEEGEQQLEA